MAKKYLDYDGLLYFWQKVKNTFVSDVSYNSTSKKIQKTKAGTTSDVVTLSTVATSGSYNDLTDKPTITSDVTDVQIDGTSVVMNGVANIDTFVGATSSADGTKGLVPAPESVTNLRRTFLCANGTWKEAELSLSRHNGLIGLLLNGTGVTIPVADATQNGVMSASDKSKLDSITMSNGKIDASVLPSYVDDVIEAYARNQQTALSQNWLSETSASGDALTPEAGKIYILMNDTPSYAANSQFRWAGTTYVKLADGGISSITNAEIDAIVAA